MLNIRILMASSLALLAVSAAAPASSNAFPGYYAGQYCEGTRGYSSCFNKYACPRYYGPYRVRQSSPILYFQSRTNCMYRKGGRWYY